VKRRIIAAGAAAVLGLGLAGCGASEGGSAGGTGGAGGSTTITYAIWDDTQKDAMQQIATAFEAENEGVTVKVEVTPWDSYWTKLQTAMTGGGGPDVFWMNGPNLGLYASNGQLAELTDLDTSKYPQGIVDLYTLDGKTYGAPKDFDSIALWYNKRLFEAAGVAEPTADWNWEDMQEAAKKLTTADVKGFASVAASQQNVYPAIYSAGGDLIAGGKSGFASADAQKGIEFLLSFINDATSPTQEQMTDTAPTEMFGSGKVAMMFSQNTNANFFLKSAEGENIQVAPLPKGPAGSISVIHGLANVAAAKGKNVDVAVKFAEFASGKAAADIQAKAGNALPAYEGTQDAWLAGFSSLNMQVFLDAAETAKPYPSTLAGADWHTVEDETLTQIWTGATPVAEGLTKISDALQASLDGEN
jgi:multiple sugar transport system substrate-binding protein